MPYYDSPAGNPSYLTPQFQQEISSHPIDGTNDLFWAETYIQNVVCYSPFSLSITSSRHATAYLVDQTIPERVGPENSPIVRYTLYYAPLPTIRIENGLQAQTYFGLSGYTGISWSPYALRAPVSHLVRYSETVSYYLSSDPTTVPTVALTQPVITGNVGSSVTRGAVDYFGPIYSTVTPYQFQGWTTPQNEPDTYTIACGVARWKGQIFERRVRTVPKLDLVIY